MGPDDRFVGEVRELLRHLYDYSYLQRHPLMEQLSLAKAGSSRERVRALREIVTEAIAELRPGAGVGFRSEAARSYNVLSMRYVEGFTVDEVCRQLALSERQVHRYLRKAERDLAAVLWARSAGSELGHQLVSEPESRSALVLGEAQRLAQLPETIAVPDLVEAALTAVQRLAERLAVTIKVEVPVADDPLLLELDRVLARQALVHTISYALQSAHPRSEIRLGVSRRDKSVELKVSYHRRSSMSTETATPDGAIQLVRSLGGQWSTVEAPEGRAVITVTLPAHPQVTVLVVDDNEGLLDLFQRYLAGEGYRLVGALSGQEGVHLAVAERPDVIVLDVMMPRIDGFDVLQRLQTLPETQHIPVVICSVLHDPELASSLGATAFLAKPVSRPTFLEALRRCLALSRAESPGMSADSASTPR